MNGFCCAQDATSTAGEGRCGGLLCGRFSRSVISVSSWKVYVATIGLFRATCLNYSCRFNRCRIGVTENKYLHSARGAFNRFSLCLLRVSLTEILSVRFITCAVAIFILICTFSTFVSKSPCVVFSFTSLAMKLSSPDASDGYEIWKNRSLSRDVNSFFVLPQR